MVRPPPASARPVDASGTPSVRELRQEGETAERIARLPGSLGDRARVSRPERPAAESLPGSAANDPGVLALHSRRVRPFGPTPGPSGICFGTLPDFIDPLEEARVEGRLERRLRTPTRSRLLVVDGTGCLPVIPNGSKQSYQLVNVRYGPASTMLTSKRGFEPWRESL